MMTLHRLKIKDMRNDLDELIVYAREHRDYYVNVSIFTQHLDFIYDKLESLQKQVQDITEWANR